ncbi:CGNR zinc finger domain-containing protein [Limobrevibacterium gyesilva]|uniref:CGNR zinc finger domain-containing protein n=1 Tax=Limobrevibacterium gyesilva TaxID=2991712 RepID=A0AA41YLS4_9PROT|nr:ABATE domain-containing protein [Limobrevibacterium gyesilva]MCW3476219.1 CGNR zinc finger domain-containing protein [Limobrevibacterium gyesilva]
MTPPDHIVAAPAEDLCLAFADTRYWRGTPEPSDELRDINDVTSWVAAASPLNGPFVAASTAGLRADKAASVFAAAIELRETLYRLFAAAAAGQDGELGPLNAALGAACSRRRLVRRDGVYAWQVEGLRPSAAALLSPVLWSAADLLAGPRRARVRQCANPQCGWLFLDDSKSANRRWCSMASCGNRAKAHRHYLKRRGAAA